MYLCARFKGITISSSKEKQKKDSIFFWSCTKEVLPLRPSFNELRIFKGFEFDKNDLASLKFIDVLRNKGNSVFKE